MCSVRRSEVNVLIFITFHLAFTASGARNYILKRARILLISHISLLCRLAASNDIIGVCPAVTDISLSLSLTHIRPGLAFSG